MTIHLKSITYRKPPQSEKLGFPFNIPIVQNLTTLALESNVTFFVGENGSGKSTLLEAIASAAKMVTVGSEGADRDSTLSKVHPLTNQLRLSWGMRTHRGFFMRAEDFFGYVRRLNQIQTSLEDDLTNIEDEYRQRSDYAKSLAMSAHQRELYQLQNKYGGSLDARSHGEGFLSLFQARFVPNGLYLLDEPEAPLSPIRQLAFLSALHDMTSKNAQFIIATHSPIILAYPGADILSFDNGAIQPVSFDSLDHVTITRDFLNNPDAFLRQLWGASD